MSNNLIQKYNVPGPRYTSYPTVPYWAESSFSTALWKQKMLETFSATQHNDGISLYIHLLYCESLCTFCGCHKHISKNHDKVEKPYIDALIQEWQLYRQKFGRTPQIKEIHLGGGTPTFFSAQNLKRLIDSILADAIVLEGFEFSFEGHPNNTTRAHLQTLYDLGFRRVSFGVQDYDAKVQQAIHRIQPFENVKRVTEIAREIGYTSISHDLVFGLPFQKLSHMLHSIDLTTTLQPDRLAFYSYAHVPWVKGNAQRGFNVADLPQDHEKRQLYELGKQHLAAHGFIEIGMDHFAKPHDSLYHALQNQCLNRNFMGYTTTNTKLLIGLGASAISDSWTAFAQNEKQLNQYFARIAAQQLPVFRGHILNREDLIIRQHILNLMCRFETSWAAPEQQFAELPAVLDALAVMQQDGLIEISANSMRVLTAGQPFVRNICMAFDLRLMRKQPDKPLFSMTI